MYSTLSEEDKKKVQEAAKKGKDPQKKIIEILSHDQKTSKSKSKGQESKGFIWENNETPASKHGQKQNKTAS